MVVSAGVFMPSDSGPWVVHYNDASLLSNVTGFVVTRKRFKHNTRSQLDPSYSKSVRWKRTSGENLPTGFRFGAGIAIFDDDGRIKRDAQSLPGPDLTARAPATTTASSGMMSGWSTVAGERFPEPDRRQAWTGSRWCRYQDRALLDHCAFVDAAVAADKNVIFHNYGNGADRFEDAADLRSCRDVTVSADLRTAANKRVRIHHGAIVDIRAGVDIHGGMQVTPRPM